MKTAKFVIAMILLATIFLAFVVSISAGYFSYRKKADNNYQRKNKLRLFCYAYIVGASIITLILMAI